MGIWFLTFRSPYRALHSKEGDSKNFVAIQIDGEAGPPNNVMVFLTREDSEGSRAPMTRTQSPGLASVFNLISSSSRSLTASALNDTEPSPFMRSAEEIFFWAVPPA